MGPVGFSPRGDRGDRGRGGFKSDRGGFRGGRGGFRSSRGGFKSPRGGFRSPRGGFKSPRGGFKSPRGGFKSDQSFRGASRGRGRGGGLISGKVTVVEPHRHEGVFIGRGAQDSLLTLNLVPGVRVYNEKLVRVEDGEEKHEYRMWNPFRSKLAAAIMGGIGTIHIKRGSKVLYLGAASGTTVSHVSDLVGPEGMVYAVEFSLRSGRDLVSVAQKRMNIVPIIEDARHPTKYRMLVGMVDVIFSDVAQPDQARILALNAHHFLKDEGHFIISIKSSCIDSTANAEAVVANEVEKLKVDKLKPLESLTLEPYERDHTVIVGIFRQKPKEEIMEE